MLLGEGRAVCLHRTFTVDKIQGKAAFTGEREKH